MRALVRATAYVGLFLAGGLLLLAITAWPPGGLMFALPFFLLFLAAAVGGVSGLLLLLTRAPREEKPGP